MTDTGEKKKYKFTEKCLLIPFILLTLIITVWMYEFYVSMDAYKQGEGYYEEGSYIRAISYFDRSLHSYTPFNPFISKSAEKLWSIGEDALKKEDQKLALEAFRTIRRGFYSANNIYQPGRDWIGRCDEKINSIINKGTDAEGMQGNYLTQDGKIPEGQVFQSPDVFWTVILEIGIIGWIGTVICFILNIFRRERKNNRVRIIRYLSVAVIFIVLWVLGMMKA